MLKEEPDGDVNTVKPVRYRCGEPTDGKFTDPWINPQGGLPLFYQSPGLPFPPSPTIEDTIGVTGIQWPMLSIRHRSGQFMPSFLPGLGEWLQHQGLPASVLVVLGFIWYELKAGEARQVKRSDELRADMKEGLAQQRAEVKELRDLLVKSLLSGKAAVRE